MSSTGDMMSVDVSLPMRRHGMNLRRKHQPLAVSSPDDEENVTRKMGFEDANDSFQTANTDSDDQGHARHCKRFKSYKDDPARFRRSQSDGILSDLTDGKDGDEDTDSSSSWSAAEGVSRKMGLDISIQLCKAMAMGADNHHVFLRQDIAEGQRMKSEVMTKETGNQGAQSVTSSILKIENDKGGISYKCKICGVFFLDYFDIYIHIRMHGGERSMRALVNQQKTLIESIPDNEVRLKGRPFECLICFRKFKLPKSLLAHVTSIHPSSEDTMIARVPTNLLPAGWVDTTPEEDEVQESRPIKSRSNNPDSSLHFTNQSLKSMKVLVETDSVLFPAAGGAKILKPSHSLAGALASPPPTSTQSLQQPSPSTTSQSTATSQQPIAEDNRALTPSRPSAVPSSDPIYKPDTNSYIDCKQTDNSKDLPLDLSMTQGQRSIRSSTTAPVTMLAEDGFLKSPIHTKFPEPIVYTSPMPRLTTNSTPSPDKFMLPNQGAIMTIKNQTYSKLPHKRFPLQLPNQDGKHLTEYYANCSRHSFNIQDPQVSSYSVDDHEDDVGLPPNPYLRPELERQFQIELEIAELQLRRKYNNLGLPIKQIDGRRKNSRRDFNLAVINELRIREMYSSHFDDDVDDDEFKKYGEMYDPCNTKYNRNSSPVFQPPMNVGWNAFSEQNHTRQPRSQPERHVKHHQAPEVYPYKHLQPRPNGTYWRSKEAKPQCHTQRSPREPIIPQLLSMPSIFLPTSTTDAHKV
ncbi:uncharacterized protein LOC135154281 [Lytechinus pictus]|uniref:uncharacterized protein LOC135154281 n=1 Tax=Lytechinus pictus TaxID=7653 RepID=UPI0030B9DC38